MTEKRMTDEELAEEARRWDSRELTPAGWEDATDAVPRAKASESISLRLPKAMLAILKEFARRDSVGYQVLIKRWLHDRIREERERREPASRSPSMTLRFDSPPMIWQAVSFDARVVNRLPDEAGTDTLGRLAALAVPK